MIDYLFSQPVYKTHFECDEFDLKYKLHKQWESKTKTSYKKENKIVKGEDYLLNKLSEYTKQITDKEHKIKLEEIWANEYGSGEFQETHIHPFTHFSFIIFKKIPKDSGHLVLYNPSVDFTYRYEKIMKPYFFQHIKLEQKDNILFIFPSYMKHMVTAGTNKIKRITYSGNFDIIL